MGNDVVIHRTPIIQSFGHLSRWRHWFSGPLTSGNIRSSWACRASQLLVIRHPIVFSLMVLAITRLGHHHVVNLLLRPFGLRRVITDMISLIPRILFDLNIGTIKVSRHAHLARKVSMGLGSSWHSVLHPIFWNLSSPVSFLITANIDILNRILVNKIFPRSSRVNTWMSYCSWLESLKSSKINTNNLPISLGLDCLLGYASRRELFYNCSHYNYKIK